MDLDDIRLNPFHVLDLPPTASHPEVERAGQRLLAMLEVELADAATYDTPLGPMPRTPDLVRRSLDALRHPERRAVHEIWAAAQPAVGATPSEPGGATNAAPTWPNALAAFGWGTP